MNDVLGRIECDFNVLEIFSYRNSTSWIRIKTFLADRLLGTDSAPIQSSRISVRAALGVAAISALNYFRYVFSFESRHARPLFVGAGSGLFSRNGEVLDAYYPYRELGEDAGPYWLSADFPERMLSSKRYLLERKAFVFSFFSAPLTALIAFFIKKRTRLPDAIAAGKIIEALAESGCCIAQSDLENLHRSYIARYWAFRILLAPLRIRDAYLVSAYSYPEICMRMKELGIMVTELQHGLIGAKHSGYNYRIHDERLPAPDAMFVYDEFWKNELLEAGFYRKDNIRITGRLKYDIVSKTRPSPLDVPFIVFTGQGVFTGKVLEFVRSGLEGWNGGKPRCRFLYLPHPNETVKDIDAIRAALAGFTGAFVGHPGGYTTEECIFHSLAHVSIYSSCHFDAVHFIGRTYVLDVMESNPMEKYMKSRPDLFIPITDASQIRELDRV